MLQKSIVLHIPHASPLFPLGRSNWEDGIEFEITRWTDWYTDWLFASSTRLDSRIISISSPFSRFFCDVERLENDPLEIIGQGIVYTRYGRLSRSISEEEKQFALKCYHEHRQRLVQALTPGALLVDCHSFPADLSDTDICVGVNDDWSRPGEALIDRVVSHFRAKGYSVGLNEPYSNSISPDAGFRYGSLMIEVNKRAYLHGPQTLDIPKAFILRRCIEECLIALLSIKWQYETQQTEY